MTKPVQPHEDSSSTSRASSPGNLGKHRVKSLDKGVSIRPTPLNLKAYTGKISHQIKRAYETGGVLSVIQKLIELIRFKIFKGTTPSIPPLQAVSQMLETVETVLDLSEKQHLASKITIWLTQVQELQEEIEPAVKAQLEVWAQAFPALSATYEAVYQALKILPLDQNPTILVKVLEVLNKEIVALKEKNRAVEKLEELSAKIKNIIRDKRVELQKKIGDRFSSQSLDELAKKMGIYPLEGITYLEKRSSFESWRQEVLKGLREWRENSRGLEERQQAEREIKQLEKANPPNPFLGIPWEEELSQFIRFAHFEEDLENNRPFTGVILNPDLYFKKYFGFVPDKSLYHLFPGLKGISYPELLKKYLS